MKRSRAIFTIFKKEMARFCKDRRTLASLILPGVLIYLVYSLMGNFMSDMFTTDEDYKPVISVINCPAEMQGMFSEEVFEIKDADNVESAKTQVAESQLDLLVVFPEDFWGDMLTYIPSPDNTAPNVEIYYNTASEESSVAYTSVMALLDGLEATISNKFDINNTDKTYDMASEESIASILFSSVMPMLLVMFCVTGCMAVAPESIAGEKERGTIATLLITPIRRSDIALGKILALSLLSMISGASSAIGVIASLPKLMGEMAEFDGSVYGAMDYAFLAIVIMSTTLLFVTLISVISCVAKSVKEAASYVSPVMVLSMVIGITGMIGNSSQAIWVYFIPVYNSVQCIVEIFSFEANALHIALAAVTNVAVMGIGVFVLTRMFNSEKVMFKK